MFRLTNTTLAFAVAFGFSATAIPAQQQSIVESNARARAIIDAAVTAHGGVDALRAAQRIQLSLRGTDHWRNQSARVDRPYDTRDASFELWLDLPASKLVTRESGAFPGDLFFASRRVTDGERAFALFEHGNAHFTYRAQPVAAQTGTLFAFVPPLAVLAAHDGRAALRAIGRVRIASGATVDAVAVHTPGGMVTMGFDPGTKLLRAILDVQTDLLAGEVSIESEFVDYRTLGGALLPERRIAYVGSEKTKEMRYVHATLNTAIPDSLLQIPSTSQPRAEDTGPAVRELAPGVWNVRQGRSHVLAVAFKDFVVVVEAPVRATNGVVAQIAKLAPGKPIRYVVPTHHHDDHSGGLRDYIAAGTTIITTPGNRAYFQRMASAHSAIDPDAQATARRTPVIETFVGRRVITDGERTLELHDIGPNEHARELVVAWIPEAGILYEGDMLNTALNGDVAPNTNMKAVVSFAEWIRRNELNVRTFVGMHHPPVAPTVLRDILAQPIVRP